MTSDYTPDSYIKGKLRQMWICSRERSAALKNTGYCCSRCGIKQTMKKDHVIKLDVHHKHGGQDEINWKKILTVIREELLVDPENLEPLCKECHNKEHYG